MMLVITIVVLVGSVEFTGWTTGVVALLLLVVMSTVNWAVLQHRGSKDTVRTAVVELEKVAMFTGVGS